MTFIMPQGPTLDRIATVMVKFHKLKSDFGLILTLDRMGTNYCLFYKSASVCVHRHIHTHRGCTIVNFIRWPLTCAHEWRSTWRALSNCTSQALAKDYIKCSKCT